MLLRISSQGQVVHAFNHTLAQARLDFWLLTLADIVVSDFCKLNGGPVHSLRLPMIRRHEVVALCSQSRYNLHANYVWHQGVEDWAMVCHGDLRGQ